MLCRMKNKEMQKVIGRIMVVIGVVSLVFGIVFTNMLDESQHNLNMLAGMFSGAGTGLLGVAVFMTIRDRRMTPEQRKEIEIEQNDERNVALMNRTMSIVAVSLVITLAVLAFVLVAMNYAAPAIMMIAAIYLQIPVMMITYRRLNNRM